VNLRERISLYYGGHPFHFYFTQAVPLVLFTFLPVAIYGIYKCKGKRRNAFMALGFVLALSVLGHKEFRFIMPVVPCMMIYAG
jgi:GPI mannosyltransferase 3